MWKDTTSYRQGQERVQTSWTANADGVRISITKSHRDYPDEWVMHCSNLNMDTVPLFLPGDEPKEVAQKGAINRAIEEAKMIADRLSQLNA